MNNLFTPLNVELAAIVCGDPNDIHYRSNPHDLQIAAGLHQLVIALDRVNAKKGHTLSVTFRRPIYVPGGAGFASDGDSFSFRNDKSVLAEGTICTTRSPEPKESIMKVGIYSIADTSPTGYDRDSWENSTTIPRDALRQILPSTETTDFSIAVLRSINPFIRAMKDDRTLLREVSFPCAREEGSLAVLETGITIDVRGARTEKFNMFTVKGYKPHIIEPGKTAVYCAEVEDLYTIRIGMHFLLKDKHKRYLQKMRRRL